MSRCRGTERALSTVPAKPVSCSMSVRLTQQRETAYMSITALGDRTASDESLS